MEHVIASVYMAALMVCHFKWHLFLARENRGAGNTDRAHGASALMGRSY